MVTTRRRGKVLEKAILNAASAELDERGYDGLTYESVAARAATSKPVIYRRWATKAELVVAAVMADAPPVAPLDDTGTLSSDLEALLVAMREVLTHAGRHTILNLLAQLDGEAAGTLLDLLFTRAAQYMTPILDRAREREEIGPLTLPNAVLSLPLDLARHEALVRGALTDAAIATITRDVSAPLFALHSGRAAWTT